MGLFKLPTVFTDKSMPYHISIFVPQCRKMYGFCCRKAKERLWVIGYGRVMGYVSETPANQAGIFKILWGMRGMG